MPGSDRSVLLAQRPLRNRHCLKNSSSPPRHGCRGTRRPISTLDKNSLATSRLYGPYLHRGYLEFSVDSTQVSLSPDRKDVFITIVINEGEKFTVKDIRLVGDLLGRNAEFARLVNIKSGEVFSNQRLQALGKSITDRLGELGYAFASVTPLPEIDRNNRVVNFALQVDPGRRVYVRSINISGNNRTRDEVIRREMRQFEATWFDGDRIRLSRNRIDRLGYFKEVDIDTVPVVGTQDQVDVNVKVEERPLGALTLGIGLSSTEKLVFQGSISQQNFLGTGTDLALSINTSRLQQTLVISHTDPYWTEDGISRSIDVYSRKFNPNILFTQNNYSVVSQGISLKYGVPYTEIDRLFLGGSIEQNHYELRGDAPASISRDISSFGSSPTAYLFNLGWRRDTRNSALTPNDGRLQLINIDFATPVGEVEYLKVGYTDQYFLPVSKTITYATNLQIDAGEGLRGKPFPNFKNYFAGGIGSVRGFEPAGIGRLTDGRQLGGDRRIVLNNEILFPFSGMGQDRSMRWFLFVDAGNVWAQTEKFDLSDLRVSSGVGIAWLSPVGPLKFSLGNALKREDFDRTQRIQFTIGTAF